MSVKMWEVPKVSSPQASLITPTITWGERLILSSAIGQLRVPDWIKWRKQGQHQPSSLSFLTVDAMWPANTCLCHHSLPWNAGPRPHTGSQKKIAPLSLRQQLQKINWNNRYREGNNGYVFEEDNSNVSRDNLVCFWILVTDCCPHAGDWTKETGAWDQDHQLGDGWKLLEQNGYDVTHMGTLW